MMYYKLVVSCAMAETNLVFAANSWDCGIPGKEGTIWAGGMYTCLSLAISPLCCVWCSGHEMLAAFAFGDQGQLQRSHIAR